MPTTTRARPIPVASAVPVLSPEARSLAAQHAIAGISVFTALLAAGSCGLIAHPLRHALTLVGILIIAAMGVGREPGIFKRIAILSLFAIVAGYLSASPDMAVSALSVVVMLGGVALADPDALSTLQPITTAIFVFSIYRLAHESIGMVWLAADHAGHAISRAGGVLAGKPLNAGATFAGVDALVLMAALVIARAAQDDRYRLRRVALWFACVLLGQAIYLVILARSMDLLSLGSISIGSISLTPDQLIAQLKDQIPWNVPIIDAIVQSIVAFFLVRWTHVGSGRGATHPRDAKHSHDPKDTRDAKDPRDSKTAGALPRVHWAVQPVSLAIGSIALAILLPLVTTLCWNHLDLTGKNIVFYKQGFLNWLKPEWGDYGRLSQGMYGLLGNSSTNMENGVGGTGSRFLDLYGVNAIVSPDLSEEDLKKADALVMMYPDKKWQPGQIDRVRNYVKNGGTLLLFGEHTIQEPKNDPDPNRPRWKDEANARFNDLLVDSNMRVRFDTAVFTVGGWLQSYEALAHPTTIGVRDERNEFGVVIGASLDVHYPAKPFIVGRFGHCDPGDAGRFDHAMLGNEKYDPGESLGDVVLAAEQRVGAGRIVLFGDTSMMSNGLLHGCYDYDSRLLAYAANRTQSPQDEWRQFLSVLLMVGLLATVSLRAHPLRAAVCATLLGVSVTVATSLSYRNATLIPGPKVESPRQSQLVYIDTSHMEAASLESWREDGLQGLELCFEREGFMSLGLEDLTRERLHRARFLISVAPQRPFSDDEREAIRTWVRRGGIFIETCGYDRAAGARQLLADFGLSVGARPGEIPLKPQGWFKAPFLDLGSFKPHVRFWAAWPLKSNSIQGQPEPQPVALDGNDDPVILKRVVLDKDGRDNGGRVILVGDTNFAMNMNLEHESGQAIEEAHENSDFWHWFIESITGVDPPWTPEAPSTQPSATAQEVTP